MPKGLADMQGDFPAGAAFGVGAPWETAQQPSGLASIFGGVYDWLGNLSKRAILGSQADMQNFGDRSTPLQSVGPALDASLATMGMGTFGAPIRGGEVAFGSGPIRKWKSGDPAPYPQYAEAYPPVGPPVTAFDKIKQKEYLAKELTPEALEFQKTRSLISADMKKNGYEPYFDPAERYHVDPAGYPANVDTTTIIPKKQATIDKDMATIGGDDARARLQAAFERGSGLPNTADWYAMGQLEKEFVKELGPEAGRKAFQDQFATSMAATTGGADPTSNYLMSQYGNYLRANGKPYPANSYEYPFPIGGRYAGNNMAMHEKVFDAGGFQTLDAANPKRHNFSQNFTGNRGAATMDEQMTSGMTPGLQMPPPGKYGLYEKVLQEEAAKAGVLPQNFQDVAWAGFKNAKDPKYAAGEPMIQTVNESIERTHRLTGMPKEEILRRGVIKGEIPMYAIGGGLSLGSILGMDDGR